MYWLAPMLTSHWIFLSNNTIYLSLVHCYKWYGYISHVHKINKHFPVKHASSVYTGQFPGYFLRYFWFDRFPGWGALVPGWKICQLSSWYRLGAYRFGAYRFGVYRFGAYRFVAYRIGAYRLLCKLKCMISNKHRVLLVNSKNVFTSTIFVNTVGLSILKI